MIRIGFFILSALMLVMAQTASAQDQCACPTFAMPVYNGNSNWNWASMQWVTCTAQDTGGINYPVTEGALGTISYAMSQTQSAENAALAACNAANSASGGCCMVTGCVPTYSGAN